MDIAHMVVSPDTMEEGVAAAVGRFKALFAHEMLQIFSVSMTDRTSMRELFKRGQLPLPEAKILALLPEFFD